jgi:mannose-1-phosphate guanylyltransferase / mannose-6-phosphate isomerase
MSLPPSVHPVILCGGSGQRLWPLSRQSYPKQFVPLMGEETLFQTTLRRFDDRGFAQPLIVTVDPFRFIVAEQMAAVGIKAADVLIEPASRNTAPAILAAALWLAQSDPQAVMLVAPSDHVMPDPAAFRAAVATALPRALAGDLVTFGIAPTRPETGYGYLQLSQAADSGPQPLANFIEKPDAATALRMLATGGYLWNAGIFLFSVPALLAAFDLHAPEMAALVKASVCSAQPDLGFVRLGAGPWAQVAGNSIDYAIMEKAANLAVMPYLGGWSDLGSWDSVWQELGPDENGNVLSQNATAIDCEGSLLRSEAEGLELVGIGLKDIVAIAMPDAVLIADKSQSQKVKEAVLALKAKSARQATAFPRDHRPWGWFDSLILGPRFQVKRIVVHPGAALSLQSHHHRSEHWIVVQGTAKVTVDDKVSLISENQSVYIPLGAVHRMENPGKLPMVLIEVQTGSYLGEDDIIRYQDSYARP